MPKKFTPLALCAALAGCAQLPAERESRPDTYGLIPSLPAFLSRQAPKPELTLSLWHQESLQLCRIQDSELEDFSLPVKVDLWDRVRHGFGMQALVNQRVQQEIEWYAKHPAYLGRVSERAEKYLYFIVEEIEQRQLPMELALLPIVESAFDPFAYSSGHAAGMWQFISGTGKMFGLKQNWWYDGRRDIVASTDAALDYLEQLYSALGNDWLLALAAYNSGEGNVQKALRKNRAEGKKTDFWSLDLPKETAMYVPRLLALKALVENPDDYGLAFYPVANQPYFVSVDVGSQIDLAQAADWAGVPLADLAALNPGFNRWATDPDGPHSLLLPRDKAGVFQQKLTSVAAAERMSWDRYQIKPGDSLAGIAKRHRTTAELLRTINDISPDGLKPGRTLLVPKLNALAYVQPASAGAPAAGMPKARAPEARTPEARMPEARMPEARTPVAEVASKIEYRVQAGDSLWGISRQYNVSPAQLALWNDMAPGDPIKPGQKLVIWQSAKVTAATSATSVKKLAYKVRQGESLSAIADKFNLRVADIVQWNQGRTADYLRPGDDLTLFVDTARVQ